MDIRTAIRKRVSTRRYSARPVDDQVLERLLTATADVLVPSGVRVTAISGREQAARVLSRYLGSYGLVKGAPHLLVGLLAHDTEPERLNLGYVLEQAVLEATRLGQATCWITGTYHPEQAAQLVDLQHGESVAAVVALGTARRDRWARLHDGAIRQLATGHRRRPLEQLVYVGQWDRPWSPMSAEPWWEEVLALARLAPSARNQQPWRFVMIDGGLALCLVKHSPIDAGIVMAHVALAAASLGRPGRWAVRWDDPVLAAELALPPGVVPVGTFSVPVTPHGSR